MSPAKAPSNKTAVVVVHGIGNPAPGATLASFTDALESSTDSLRFSTTTERRALSDYAVRGDKLRRSFPCHVRRAERSGREYVFAINLLMLCELAGLMTAVWIERAFEWDVHRALFVVAALGASAWGAYKARALWAKALPRGSMPTVANLRRLGTSPFRLEVWGCLAVGGFLAALCGLVLPTTWKGYGFGLNVALAIAFSLAVLGQALCSALYLFGFAFRRTPDRQSALADTIAVTAQAALWIVLVPNAWAALLGVLPKCSFGTYASLPKDMIDQALMAQGTHGCSRSSSRLCSA